MYEERKLRNLRYLEEKKKNSGKHKIHRHRPKVRGRKKKRQIILVGSKNFSKDKGVFFLVRREHKQHCGRGVTYKN